MTEFIAVYHVQLPIVRPLFATAGMLLTVWPAHPTHTLAVTMPFGSTVVDYCTVAPGVLYGLVMEWEDLGVIAPLSSAYALPRSA
jgi:hypothetical protein